MPEPSATGGARGRSLPRRVGVALSWLLYDVVWALLLVLGFPWWGTRALLSASFREMVGQRLGLSTPRLGQPEGRGRVLIHGVSVGEVKASQSLVAALREEFEVVVSASTDSGLAVARQLFPDLHVARFPIDYRPAVRRFLERVQPSAVVLLELEIWPRFVRSSTERGIPTAVVSGRITPASFRKYRRFSPTLTQFEELRLVAAQLEDYAERFRGLGVRPERIVVTGNVKVDGLEISTAGPSDAARALARELGLEEGRMVLVAGSTHDPEEVLVAGAFREAAPEAEIVLVPRHPPRADQVVTDLAAAGIDAQRLTELRAGVPRRPGHPVVVDTIGELEHLYSLATLAFVGGTLIEHGGQNVLEPAAKGCPVLHGPDLDNFRQEAALLQNAGASRLVRDGASLAEAVRALLADRDLREEMGRAGQEAIASQRGATERTVEALERAGIFPARQSNSSSGPSADESIVVS